MNTLLAVALGGAVGASARYGVGMLAWRIFGPGFSWATVSINIFGSFLLGLLVAYMALRGQLAPEWRAFWTVGVLGAFTTFSTFSMEAVDLMNRGHIAGFAAYVIVSVVGALTAFWVGLRLFRYLFA